MFHQNKQKIGSDFSGRTLFVGFVCVSVLIASECLYLLPHVSGGDVLKVLLYVSDAPVQCLLIYRLHLMF